MKKTRPQQEKRQRVVPFLIGSLLVHLFIVLGFFIHDSLFTETLVAKVKPEPSVQFLDLQDINNGRLVEQDEKEKPTEKPKDAKFLSAHDKAVEKETRAMTRGDFQNKNSAEAPKAAANQATQAQRPQVAQPAQPVEPNTAENMKTFTGGDVTVPSKPAKKEEQKAASTVADLRPNTMQNMSESAMASVSQTQDYLKDVAAGAETQLNTREFLYYSYFNRIKKQLHQRWEPIIHEKVRNIVKKGQQRELASTEIKVTNVVFTLDDRGVIVRIQVGSTSGLEDLDDAAVEALKAVGQFPNPPKDLIVEGLVKIQWSFILES